MVTEEMFPRSRNLVAHMGMPTRRPTFLNHSNDSHQNPLIGSRKVLKTMQVMYLISSRDIVFHVCFDFVCRNNEV